MIDSVEYVSATPLPANGLFDNPVELAKLLAYTKTSIEERAVPQADT